ncbi:MAG: type I methionyl aminopeptidase [Candidatus Magasanikbacteria bacterium RIFCSPHIGHO2_01_FULL_41_23]|uniref:Methionine aminopeptidase n=1 Tax=Candidatus Magasanikbacteria bacterium RIFCSPLOWO2_01_FULL_40_15 TaxID=1798686 RepID=A0A1F6N2I4_9BACT|nr:MAG: type I methionyl aminopeptidase [Candidatus Magasanikbacteria bacterium RIFCSPHIGHO2_01_FULL_41_23]OGH66835.1 MAG: type I methionyl aminopeptidase [Candidatus Magasanikbacteria bacterium RIFCSPHIGHO2_02_FULL_41_35]OGH74818.1 MAG: type I methionyl aminopeptidase [Candidatus Magasanikbacteria bacterium RIFCSPHIGHO2_12_FULL_41_16]OGH78094.1 MAG: type I methionyl aminopeptidase [Candidatus Magasanikbacteria bacterium RIFCSPLOWO2_01_FULL_40_15]
MYTKKPQEIELIIEGGKLMGEILEKLAGLIKPGVSAWEIDVLAEQLILEAGGKPAFKGYRTRKTDPPFPSTVCFSINQELVHGIPRQDKIVKDGDIVSLDIGMEYPVFKTTAGKADKGYFTDTALTVAVGKIPQEVEKLMAVTREALEVGIRAAQVGKTVADIGRAIQTYVESEGKYGIVRDLVGHGVGHAVHEAPRVPNYYDKDLENWILQPGVVIAIEPMIALGSERVDIARDGWTIFTRDKSLNAHFEHTIIIAKDGPIVATRRPNEFL